MLLSKTEVEGVNPTWGSAQLIPTTKTPSAKQVYHPGLEFTVLAQNCPGLSDKTLPLASYLGCDRVKKVSKVGPQCLDKPIWPVQGHIISTNNCLEAADYVDIFNDT